MLGCDVFIPASKICDIVVSLMKNEGKKKDRKDLKDVKDTPTGKSFYCPFGRLCPLSPSV